MYAMSYASQSHQLVRYILAFDSAFQGQSLEEQLSAAISGRGNNQSKATPSTPTGAAAAADVSTTSTPGVPLPPNPPPTPQGGIPVPPPPPPTLPGAAGVDSHRSNLKRVNWEKIHGTEGTIWREVGLISCMRQS